MNASAVGDYDFYLRHAAVRDGAWVGFRLAWKGLAGVAGLFERQHERWRPWVMDPTFPNDPTKGAGASSSGGWRWRWCRGWWEWVGAKTHQADRRAFRRAVEAGQV